MTDTLLPATDTSHLILGKKLNDLVEDVRVWLRGGDPLDAGLTWREDVQKAAGNPLTRENLKVWSDRYLQEPRAVSRSSNHPLSDSKFTMTLCVCEALEGLCEVNVPVAHSNPPHEIYNKTLLNGVIKLCTLFRNTRSRTIRIVCQTADGLVRRGRLNEEPEGKELADGLADVEEILGDLGFSCRREEREEFVVTIDKRAYQTVSLISPKQEMCMGSLPVDLGTLNLHSVLVVGDSPVAWKDVVRWTKDSWAQRAPPDVSSIPAAVLRVRIEVGVANILQQDVTDWGSPIVEPEGRDLWKQPRMPEVQFDDFAVRAGVYSRRQAMVAILGVVVASVLSTWLDTGAFHFLLALVFSPYLPEETDMFWALGWTGNARLLEWSVRVEETIGWHSLFTVTMGVVEVVYELGVDSHKVLDFPVQNIYISVVGLFWIAILLLGTARVHRLTNYSRRHNLYRKTRVCNLGQVQQALGDDYIPLRKAGLVCVRCGDGMEEKVWWLSAADPRDAKRGPSAPCVGHSEGAVSAKMESIWGWTLVGSGDWGHPCD